MCGFELRRPCKSCPFRTDIKPFLHAARAREIARALVHSTFTCHMTTVDSEEDENGDTHRIDGPDAQHCAGALIMLEHAEEPSQMMRIAERLRLYDRTKLDMTSPVYTTPAAFVAAHKKNR